MTADRRFRPAESLSDVAIVHDAASGAWMIDVTSCCGIVDRAMFNIGDAPILACFGDHENSRCPLTGRVSTYGKHAVVFDVVSGRCDHATFVRRFEELSRSRVEVLRSTGPGRDIHDDR